MKKQSTPSEVQGTTIRVKDKKSEQITNYKHQIPNKSQIPISKFVIYGVSKLMTTSL